MDYRAMVNPTYLTAKSTLLMLAAAGNEDAKRMIEGLGTQDELTQNSNKAKDSPLSPEELKALMAGTTTSIEARYAALSRYMRTNGYTNLLDIACGYTPRSLYCDQQGIDYVGVDVPVVAEELIAFSARAGIQKSHPIYVGGDATNAASLNAAADMLNGQVVISCEGLTQYLSEDEFAQLIGAIREILTKHGGTWVTSDMGVNYEAFATACMSGEDAAERYHAARRQSMNVSNIFNEGVGFWDAERKQKYLEAHGFIVNRLPLYHGDENLSMLSQLLGLWKAALERELAHSELWEMSVDPSFDHTAVQGKVIEGAKQVDNLKISYVKNQSTLHCTVSGRIDTLSAPALLEVFENNYGDIQKITVDAEALQYISSAGLRVLMMAVKKLGEGTVTVLNANEGIREIFETTGFDNIIQLS